MKLEYNVVIDFTYDNFKARIENMLKSRWELSGGVSVTVLLESDGRTQKTVFAQALTRAA